MSCRNVLLLVLVAVTVLAADAAQSGYLLRSSVVGAAGVPVSSTLYRSQGTLGQPTPIGVGASSGKTLYAGFWSAPWAVASVGGDSPTGGLADCLFNSAPNPFGTATQIAYSLGAEGSVEVAIFDTAGRRVRTLVDEVESPGRHVVSWDGRDYLGSMVSPGVYFYRLKTSTASSVKKLIVVR